jgi:dihydrofolate synthase/folylpolyglutamate synthase
MATDLYASALDSLEQRGFGIRADLGRIRALMALLNDPQLTYPTIHLAGTNGKSSTSRMIASILAGHGLTTGLYVSPHLQSVRERFSRFGMSSGELSEEIIDEEWFGKIFDYLKPFAEMVESERREDITYFEMTTAVAYEWMADAAVDVGVFEAGMGGRWDATNLVMPRVSVLTEIAVDHRKFLGETPLDNAREKVGIIKEGSVVVSASQLPEVAELIESVSDELLVFGEEFLLTSDELAVGGRRLTVKGARATYEELFLPLFGVHQARNFAVAVAACESFLGRALDHDTLRGTAESITSPGRMEVVGHEPLVVLDGAHNPAGATALEQAVRDSFSGKHRTLVITVLQDKDADEMIPSFESIADRIIFTKTKHGPRPAANPEDLRDLVKGETPTEVIDDMKEAVKAAIEGVPDGGMVIVTGSLYGVGEAREALVGKVA